MPSREEFRFNPVWVVAPSLVARSPGRLIHHIDTVALYD
jgi:hypothetical protein